MEQDRGKTAMKTRQGLHPALESPVPEGWHNDEDITSDSRRKRIERLHGLEALLATYDQHSTDEYVVNLKQRVYQARARIRQGL